MLALNEKNISSTVVDATTREKLCPAIRRAVWIYILLLLFEGALRKWFLPGLATPLLVIRDPLALWIIFSASRKGLLNNNIYFSSMIFTGIAGIFLALFLGHGNLMVAIYGARILLFHFPLIFIIGRVFNKEDVLKVGQFLCYAAIPMTIIIALQFYSPQSAWVNRGVGGDLAGAGFSGSLGYFRPSGTFSFTNGIGLFYSLLAPFVVYFWLHANFISKWLLVAATLGLLASIPLSISRGLFFSILVTIFFTLIVTLRKPKYRGPFLAIGMGIVIALLVLNNFTFFTTATSAFTSRFEVANEVEGGVKGVLLDRYLGGMLGALTDNSSQLPFFGYGTGMGTNVGSMLLTGGTIFLISEGEWGRLIGESGILIGLLIILLRVGLSAKLAIAAYTELRYDNLLPWLLLSFALLQIPQGQWAQPTSLGFAVLGGGLAIAALKESSE